MYDKLKNEREALIDIALTFSVGIRNRPKPYLLTNKNSNDKASIV